jgi:hypothetical protein
MADATIQCQDDLSGGIILDKASPANFSLVLPNLPPDVTIADTQELIINIYGTVIPGVSLDVLEMYWVLGKTHMDSGGITWEPFTIEYIVDESLLNWRILHKWMMYINNNKDRRGRPPQQYTIDATIRVLDNFQKEIFKLFFVNLWVSAVGEVRFSTREGQANLESTAQFTYDRYELRDAGCED